MSPASPSAVDAGHAGSSAVVTTPSKVAAATTRSASAVAVAAVAATPVREAAIPVVPVGVQSPRALQKVDAVAQAAVTKVFHGLINWISTLQVNSWSTWLQGALLIVRKSVLNQKASVSSVQTVNTAELVTGKLEVIDPEGDGWKVEVVTTPSQGTVVLGDPAQENGIGTVKYTYAPQPGYAGTDQFVVKVTPTNKTFNLLHPFGASGYQYLSIAVGSAADPLPTTNSLDTTLFMSNTGATVQVRKQGLLSPRYATTVTLAPGYADRSFAWMDSRGNTGSIPVETMLTEKWPAFAKKAAQNAVRPVLAFNYSEDGVAKTVFVDVNAVNKNADGSYELNGYLMADAPAQDGRVDAWDYLGIDYKSSYENFLAASGLKNCKSGAVCTTVSAVGFLGATTYSPSSAVEAGYRDHPLPRAGLTAAVQTSPGSMGPGTESGNISSGAGAIPGGQPNGSQYPPNGSPTDGPTQLTTMVPYGTGGSFIAATNLNQQANQANNGVDLYTASSPAGSTPTWSGPNNISSNGWDSPVISAINYNQTVVDDNGNPVPASFVSAGGGAIQPVSITVAQQQFSGGISGNQNAPGNVLQLIVPTDWVTPATSSTAATCTQCSTLVNATISGTGIAPNTVITGYQSIGNGPGDEAAQGNVATYSVSGAPQLVGAVPGKTLQLALSSGMNPWDLVGQTITADGIPTDTVITGLVSGTVGGNSTYSVSNTVWIPGGTVVTTPNFYSTQPGAVIGLANGAVEYWSGNGCSADATACSGGWTEIHPYNGNVAFPTAPDVGGINILVDLPGPEQGIVMGTSGGDVYQWKAYVYSDGALVGGPSGCSNSNTPGCWTLLGTPDGSAVNAMIASPGGVTVGTANGGVWQYRSGIWTELGSQSSAVNTLLPYDGTTLVGAISAAPVVANTGPAGINSVVATPDYLPTLLTSAPELQPLVNSCESAYDQGSGTGCNGFLLTVQSVAGTPITAGQTLYGGAGLTPGTTIKEQLSDASGNLCSVSCIGGGAGIYLVDQYQFVAPGTPMSASDGKGVVAGYDNGVVYGYGNGLGELADGGWGTGVNAVIPWRDGLVAGLGYLQSCPGACNVGKAYYYGGVFSWRPGANGDSAVSYAGNFTTGWTTLQGPSSVTATGTGTGEETKDSPSGWAQAVTAMTPFADGFAVGLTAQEKTTNSGMVAIYTGYDTSNLALAPFGYAQGSTGPQALTASNSFNQISDPGTSTDLAGGQSNGTVQQMFAFSQTVSDTSSGATVPSNTLVVGLTNNAIWSWNSTTGAWSEVQQPSPQNGPPALGGPTGEPLSLEDAWTWASYIGRQAVPGFFNFIWAPGGGGICQKGYGTSCATPVKQQTPPNSPTALTEDPIFSNPGLQSYQGANWASYGDYQGILAYKGFGKTPPVVAQVGEALSLDFDLASLTYGYIYYPNGVFDKFIPGKYSVGILSAVTMGPTLDLNIPGGGTCLQSTCGTQGLGNQHGLKQVPLIGDTFETEVGSFQVSAGVGLGLSIGDNFGTCTAAQAECRVDLAHAFYTTGMLWTWNVPDGAKMNMSFNHVLDTQVNPVTGINNINVTPKVVPYVEAKYGLFTPPSTPIIGEWTVFDLGLKYQNPISIPLTWNSGSGVQMKVTSQGILTAFAQFIPKVTSWLSWAEQWQVYNDTLLGPFTAPL